MHDPDEMNAKRSYWPLFVVVALAFLTSAALQAQAGVVFYFDTFLGHAMGVFFLLLSMFKLFDLNGFADGFQMYDILAKKTRLYAYAYPFIELILGLLYLSGRLPLLTHGATIILMAISASGVFISMKHGYKFQCACLGTVLNVPLSTVSLVENIGMGVMAAYMLI